MKKSLPNGVVHKLPQDMRMALENETKFSDIWCDITPLARNEWICWVTDAKKDETRSRRINIMLDKFKKGERRPCCWAGCVHR